MAFVHHRYGKTHYTRKGRNHKTPVIWLHGGPGGTHKPDGNIFSLAGDRQVYCYTQVGGGLSSATPKRHWTIPTFVRELSLLVESWGLEEFHLMGGSWGATLALEFYLRNKGKGIRSLVFQSPMFSARDWRKDARLLIQELPAKTRDVINTCHRIGATDSKVYESAMKEFYLKHVLRDSRKLARMFSRKNPNGNSVYEYMWGPSEFEPSGTLKDYNRIGDLAQIDVPTLLLCGEFDEATPGTCTRYANKIPGCSFEVVKGASHAIWEEHPSRIRRLINDFLDGIKA